MGKKAFDSYQELVEQAPKIAQFFSREQWEVIQTSNQQVGELLKAGWKENVVKNLDKLFTQHGTIKDGCKGLGLNRAVIGIGAGPSFNKNKEVLQKLCWLDARAELETGDHPFILMASNHQFKPLLELGIIPHFVFLADGSDVVFDQLCTDIPEKAKGCILLCPLRASNKVLTEWTKQGRSIKFYVGENPELMKEFENHMGYDPRIMDYAVNHGGNVLNQMFITGLRYFNSTVFIGIGNDLSYDYDPDLEKRRGTYYADGDYSTNLGTGRDEAKKCFPWMAYELEESILMPGEYTIRFLPRMTTGQLLLYKMWAENQIAVQETWKKSIHYYNCTEGGILGVLSKKGSPLFWDEKTKFYKIRLKDQRDMFLDKDNWYLLDEILPKRWHTTSLAKAADGFLFARMKMKERERGIIVNA